MTLAYSVNDVIHGRAPFGSLVGVFDEQDELIWALGFLVFLLGAYFIPTAVAFSRDVRSRWLVAVINTFLGWRLWAGWSLWRWRFDRLPERTNQSRSPRAGVSRLYVVA